MVLFSKNACDNEIWYWGTLTDFGCVIHSKVTHFVFFPERNWFAASNIRSKLYKHLCCCSMYNHTTIIGLPQRGSCESRDKILPRERKLINFRNEFNNCLFVLYNIKWSGTVTLLKLQSGFLKSENCFKPFNTI